MNRADLDYLTSEGTVWRCNPCSVTRRASFRLYSKANEVASSTETRNQGTLVPTYVKQPSGLEKKR
ncbi:hypothetical protein J6590_042625 [Homalodisca vitripennis]|nr:hypothetical protein J6590_042625 [Homalodisca vitripennis]